MMYKCETIFIKHRQPHKRNDNRIYGEHITAMANRQPPKMATTLGCPYNRQILLQFRHIFVSLFSNE